MSSWLNLKWPKWNGLLFSRSSHPLRQTWRMWMTLQPAYKLQAVDTLLCWSHRKTGRILAFCFLQTHRNGRVDQLVHCGQCTHCFSCLSHPCRHAKPIILANTQTFHFYCTLAYTQTFHFYCTLAYTQTFHFYCTLAYTQTFHFYCTLAYTQTFHFYCTLAYTQTFHFPCNFADTQTFQSFRNLANSQS